MGGRWVGKGLRRFIDLESAIDHWPTYQIEWKDGGAPTPIRARTDIEAENIAIRFAVAGKWVYTRVTKIEEGAAWDLLLAPGRRGR